MKEKVAVVGLNYQGLAVARLLGQAGYDVYAFCLPYEMAWGEFRSSRYLRGKVMPYHSVEELINMLSSLAVQMHEGDKMKVFITSSDSLSELVSEGRELWERYQVNSGPLAAIDVFSNKSLMYKKCMDLGIRVKRFSLLTDYSPGMLQFPIILKRNVEKGLMEYKCCKIEDEVQLYEIAKDIPAESREYILLQECIGEDFCNIEFRGYAHKGEIIGYAVLHAIRDYPAGVFSFMEEFKDERIVESVYGEVADLLKGSGFTGLMDIDMKCNLSTGETYLLDFNPRSPASLTAWVFRYRRKDLIELFKHIDNPKKLTPVNTSMKWCNLSRDFKARKKCHEKFKLGDVLKTNFDTWDSHDPLPFLLQPLWILIRKVSNYKKGVVN